MGARLRSGRALQLCGLYPTPTDQIATAVTDTLNYHLNT
jgi:hypothetical protein